MLESAPMKPETRSSLQFLARAAAIFAAAAVLSGVAFRMVLFEINRNGNIVEGGPVEMLQVSILALSAIAYALLAWRRPAMRRALAIVALTTLAMALRELDGCFDRLLFHGAWGLLDAFVLAAIVVVLLRAFDRTAAELAAFAATPQCLLFVAGLVFAAVVGQLIGYKELWNRIFDVEIWTDAAAPHLQADGHLPGDIDVVRHVKNTVEESFELGSYLLILASAILPPLLRRGQIRD